MKKHKLVKDPTARKLTAYASLAVAAISSSTNTHAAIQYSDIDPDTLINGNGSIYELDLDNDGTKDFRFSVKDIGSVFSYAKSVQVEPLGNNRVLASQFGMPNEFGGSSPFGGMKLENGEVIGTSYRWGPGAFQTPSSIFSFTIPSELPLAKKNHYSVYKTYSGGNFLGLNDKYLGLKLEVASQYYYGWVRVDVGSNADSLRVMDYAYENQAGKPILAGSIVCPLPSTPSGANTVKITQTTAKLDYGSSTIADKYRIRWREKAGPGPWNFRHKSAHLPTHIYLNGLIPNTTYQWQVKALNCNDDSISAFTPVQEFTTLPAGCTVPVSLNATNIEYDGATLNWSQSVVNDGYRIRWKPTIGGAWKYRNLGNGSNSTAVNYLMSNTQYDWQVRTKCPSAAYTGWSPVSQFITSVNNCQAPTNLWTMMDGQNCIDLHWDAPAHPVNRYKIQYRETPGGTWKHRTVHDSLATVFNVCHINPSTNYHWIIRSECPTGQNSVPSAYDFFATPAFKTLVNDGKESGLDRLRVYPNPVKDLLHLSRPVAQDQLAITNILGERVEGMIDDRSNTLDVSALPNGVYFILVKGEPKAVRFVKVD